MGNMSPILMKPASQIEKIEEENSDNEGDGGAASLHLKRNNYDKSKNK